MIRKAFITHNLSSENLEFSEFLGGIVNPSLAIVTNELPIDGYGEIMLVTEETTLNKYNFHGYFCDSYSKRFPRVFWNLEHEELGRYKDELASVIESYGITKRDMDIFRLYDSEYSDNSHLEDGLYRKSNSLINNTGLMLKYCHENNIDINIEFKDIELPLPYISRETLDLLKNDGFFNDSSNCSKYFSYEETNKDMRNYVLNLYEDKEKELLTEEEIQAEISFFKDSVYFNGDDLSFSMFTQLKMTNTDDDRRVNYHLVRNELESKIPKGKEWEDWIDNQIHSCFTTPYFFNSKNKKVEATLDNLAKEMKNKTKAHEVELFTSSGNIRAALETPTKSVKKLTKYASEFVSKEDFEEIKDNNNELMHSIVDEMRSLYKWSGNSMMYKDETIKLLIRYAKTGDKDLFLDDFNMDDEMISKIDVFFEQLKSSKTSYCEIKLNEPMPINSFSDAIVSKDTSKDIIDRLNRANITIHYYSDQEDIKRLLLMTGKGMGELGQFRLPKSKEQSPNISI